MLVTDILKLESVHLDDGSHSKKRALEQAASLLNKQSPSVTSETIFERLLERERLGSTGLTGGVALPHARMPGINKSQGVFIRLTEAIDFDSMDGQPVDLIFALLVPEEATDEHLQLLAQLARLFSDPNLRNSLRKADAQQALELLTQESAHHAA